MDTYESGYVYMGLEKQYRMNINQFAKRLIDGKFPKRRQGGTKFSILFFFSIFALLFLKISAWFDVDETLWDLGFNISLLDDFNFVDKSIEYLNNEFDVVLIAEQFDESLIVMKEHLCWNTEDILYLKVCIEVKVFSCASK